jgi:hypothetical protein
MTTYSKNWVAVATSERSNVSQGLRFHLVSLLTLLSLTVSIRALFGMKMMEILISLFSSCQTAEQKRRSGFSSNIISVLQHSFAYAKYSPFHI